MFQLFLDCAWQLLRQFPAAFAFTEAYLLALHDSSYVPFFSTFLFSCQWERSRGGQVGPGVQDGPGSWLCSALGGVRSRGWSQDSLVLSSAVGGEWGPQVRGWGLLRSLLSCRRGLGSACSSQGWE